ncbi:MAG: hypothetical protein JW820_05365 [Spirochaetales bacterium]|nr:hypothetical protein [Spirochaetales bacterium]
MARRSAMSTFFLLCVLGVLSPGAGGEPANGERSLYHMAAISAGYMTPALGIEDAYWGAYREALSYELHGLIPRVPVSFGVSTGVDCFFERAELFFGSYMIEVAGLVQVDFRVPIGKTLQFQPTPYIGYKHYFRYHVFEDIPTRANRPVGIAGVKLKLLLPEGSFVELNMEYNLVFDNQPVHILAFAFGVGPVFSGLGR